MKQIRTLKDLIEETIRKEVAEGLERGELSINAPFPGQEVPWSEEEKRKLKEAMKQVFGKDGEEDV